MSAAPRSRRLACDRACWPGWAAPRPTSRCAPRSTTSGPARRRRRPATPAARWPPLVLADIEASGALDGSALLYRLGYADAHQLRPYAHARWSAPPPQLIRQRLREQLARERPVLDLARARRLARNGGAMPRILRIELEEFSHYFEAPAQSWGLVRLRATLMDNTPGGRAPAGPAQRRGAAARAHARRAGRRARAGRRDRRRRRGDRAMAGAAALKADLRCPTRPSRSSCAPGAWNCWVPASGCRSRTELMQQSAAAAGLHAGRGRPAGRQHAAGAGAARPAADRRGRGQRLDDDPAARHRGRGQTQDRRRGSTSRSPATPPGWPCCREGAVIGEMSMLDGEPRYASCWALSEVEAAVLTRAAVGRLISAHPARGRQAAGQAHAVAGAAPAQHQQPAGQGAAGAAAGAR